MEKRLLENNENFLKIENAIYIKKNFLTDFEYTQLLHDVENLPEKEWDTHPTEDYESGRISTNITTTLSISQKLIDYVIPTYWPNEHKTINRMKVEHPGNEFGWSDWNVADYLVIYYFGDYEGGNIRCYKVNEAEKYNTLNIEKNTLYLLPIKDYERYISEPVTAGIKYSFIDWLYHHSEWALP
jgi:hypothetical protein